MNTCLVSGLCCSLKLYKHNIFTKGVLLTELCLFENVFSLVMCSGSTVASNNELPTCPSFCMRVQRSRTSVPHSAAACTHACAYCPTTELWRFRGDPGKDKSGWTWASYAWNIKWCVWWYKRGHSGNKRCYLSQGTLSPRKAHEWAGGWWRSLCPRTLRTKPGAWSSPSGSRNTPSVGRAVGGFYLHKSPQKHQHDHAVTCARWIISRRSSALCRLKRVWIVPFSAQSLAPKKTVTAAMLLSSKLCLLMRRGRTILAHLELYPDNPLFTTSHFLRGKRVAHPLSLSSRSPQQTQSMDNTCLAKLLASSAPQPFDSNENWKYRRKFH